MFNIKIIGSHKNCLDGNSCMAIESNIDKSIKFKYLLNPNEKFGNNLYFNWIILLASYICTIKIIFTDIIPSDIINVLNFYRKYNIKIEIIDHHHTQQALIDELIALNFSNLIIDFKPNSKFGATKQLVEKYQEKLTSQQINFFMKIAACDMWNKEYFQDFNFFIFGVNLLKFDFNINEFDPDLLWDASLEGDMYTTMFIDDGKKFYCNVKKIIEELIIKTQKIINYLDYNILLINTSNLPSPYDKMNMIPVICYYFVNKKTDINTLAIYNNTSKFISLRSIGTGINVSELAKSCAGGGHKSAAGCNFNEFIKLTTSNVN